MTASTCFTFFTINKYKSLNQKEIVELNDLFRNVNNKKYQIELIDNNLINPFEIIQNKSLEKDFDTIFLKKLDKCLYNTPLTNKLYPKSNLYGHELIRYFDF